MSTSQPIVQCPACPSCPPCPAPIVQPQIITTGDSIFSLSNWKLWLIIIIVSIMLYWYYMGNNPFNK